MELDKLKKVNVNKIKFQEDSLKDFSIKLLTNGFRVFVYNAKSELDKANYIFISKNDKVGYIQLNDFIGFQFSTVHKANKTTGTGYCLNYDEGKKPTIKNAEETFIFCPNWARKNEIESIKKYESVNDWLKQTYLIYNEVTL